MDNLDDLFYTEDVLDKIAKRTTQQEANILYQSNLIEGESSPEALVDALISWNYAKLNRSNLIDHSYVKNVHFLLMRRIDRDIRGRYRKVMVSVGDRNDTYFPEEIELGMEEWCKNFNKTKDSEEEIIDEHVKFLKIHPFADGNGRTARILMNIQKMNSGYGLHLIYVPEDTEMDSPHGDNYMDWFK